MCLQAIRTDAGRINFMNYLTNPLVFRPRRFPLELEEIKNNEVAIDAFNRIFKVKNNLENLFHLFERPDEMDFYIALTDKNLITSDNPVTGNDDFRQFILPIHPNICIEFLDKNKYQFKEPTLLLTDNKVDFLNKTTISSITRTYLDIVATSGHTVGIYASSSWFLNYIDVPGYPKWVANWGINDGQWHNDFSNQAYMQQYTSYGNLDRDLLFIDPNLIR